MITELDGVEGKAAADATGFGALPGVGKPLEGVRILALEQAHALPFATQLLARLGADVVRVENPKGGESSRATHPAMRDPEGRLTGSTFLRNNLNKRSISINTKSAEGQRLIIELAKKFDVFAENFRSGTLDRLGLGYADLARSHPRLVYASISGFGNDSASPYFGQSAYAPVVEAMSAFYDFKRQPAEPPVVGAAGAIGDTAAGLFVSVGILAALRQRDRDGVGQHVDVAMLDSMIALVDVMMSYHSLGGISTVVPSNLTAGFRAKDGYFVLMCSRKSYFDALATVTGHPEWIDHPGLQTGADWGARIDDIIRPAVEAWAAHLTRAEAVEQLRAQGIAAGPCQSIEEVIADPHVIRRNMVVKMNRVDGIDEPVLSPGNPIKLSNMAETRDERVPWLGEHTTAFLGQELGLAASEIRSLRDRGIIF